MPRVLGSDVYVHNPDSAEPTQLSAGMSEDQVREVAPWALDNPGVMGDHVWVEGKEQPESDEPTDSSDLVERQSAELEQRAADLDQREAQLAQREADVERREADVTERERVVEQRESELANTGTTQEPSGDVTAGAASTGTDDTDVDELPSLGGLNKAELKEVAANEGVEIDDGDTNAQIAQKIEAKRAE